MKIRALMKACDAVWRGTLENAADILAREYPLGVRDASLATPAWPRPHYSVRHKALPLWWVLDDAALTAEAQMLEVFIRDGFVDRYTGELLVFIPALRVLSTVLGHCFPYDSGWAFRNGVRGHQAYWELGATIDHVTPRKLGGFDGKDNLVATSMLVNGAKGNKSPSEAGLELLPCGDFLRWDGMLCWFHDYCTDHPEARKPVERWFRTARVVLGKCAVSALV
jgi:hypothetical protein